MAGFQQPSGMNHRTPEDVTRDFSRRFCLQSMRGIESVREMAMNHSTSDHVLTMRSEFRA